jgi:hypothetical protein
MRSCFVLMVVIPTSPSPALPTRADLSRVAGAGTHGCHDCHTPKTSAERNGFRLDARAVGSPATAKLPPIEEGTPAQLLGPGGPDLTA